MDTGLSVVLKKLRPELENVMGEEAAQGVFKRLILALRVVIGDGPVYLFVPESRVPHGMDKSIATDIAKLIRVKYEGFLERQDYVFSKRGSRWLVIFKKGQPCYFPDIKGMEYIAQLLEKSPKPIPAYTLQPSRCKDDR